MKKIIVKSPEKVTDESANINSFEQPEHDDSKDNKVFQLIISEKNWNDIKPVAKIYHNRRYLKLKPENGRTYLQKKYGNKQKFLVPSHSKTLLYFQVLTPNFLFVLMLCVKNLRQYYVEKCAKN